MFDMPEQKTYESQNQNIKNTPSIWAPCGVVNPKNLLFASWNWL
jgi:hypothetical protein